MNQMNLKGEIKAAGSFTYDSVGRKLRFRSNESHPTNTSLGLDLLMFFDEVAHCPQTLYRNVTLKLFHDFTREYGFCFRQGIFYEIDSKNQSCEKKKLRMTLHPLDIPDDAKFYSTVNTGSPSIEGEGLKVQIWTGSLTDMKGGIVDMNSSLFQYSFITSVTFKFNF